MIRNKEDIEEEVLKVILMYDNNQDYIAYLNTLSNRKGIIRELEIIFGVKNEKEN